MKIGIVACRILIFQEAIHNFKEKYIHCRKMHAEKRINMGNRIAQNVIIKSVKKFWNEEDGMGVVEIVLITVVLIGLVIIFKSQITSLVNKLLSKMTSQANKI